MSVIERLNTALEGRYRIEHELGAGGMATVYLADDLKHNRRVAIKVLRPELAAVVGAERFLAEIETTANLQHPHILPLFDSGEADSFLFYVMPYVEGETLQDRLGREKQLPVDAAVRIVCDLAEALHAAHERGIIHRDIKPANILLSGGRPLIADFGIALALGAAGGGRLTETGLSVGTPYYMSPEQATGEQNVGPPSDIYALGCVLYELLVGDPPYAGTSAQAVLGKIIAGAPVNPTAERPSIPANVDAAIRCALEKLPADRFAEADALAGALRDPGFRHGPGSTHDSAGSTFWKPLALGSAVAAVAALAFAATRSGGTELGVRDVGLPHDAPMLVGRITPAFAVSPDGSFIIYESDRGDVQELWYRSLETQEVRPIRGTEGTFGTPMISPDGSRVAFAVGDEFRITNVDGEGSPTVAGQAATPTGGEWREDGTIVYSDNDGRLLRWVDPDTGPMRDNTVLYCLYPTLRSNDEEVLCGGGSYKFAFSRSIEAPEDLLIWTRAESTAQAGATIRGSHFRIIEDAYLVYIAIDGTLMAAPIEDSDARTVGRSASFFANIRRETYTGAGQYDISANGTLVFGSGRNGEVGRLVEVSMEGEVQPLNLGEAAYLRFEPSPDGTRFATVVEVIQGQELRVYDLGSGTWEVIDEAFWMGYPAWSPDGRRLVYSKQEANTLQDEFLYMWDFDEPDQPSLLRSVQGMSSNRQPSSFLSPDSIILGGGSGGAAILLDLSVEPVRVDSLPINPFFLAVSPDHRWVAWTPEGEGRIVLQTWPEMDRRYSVTNDGSEARWLADGRLVYYAFPEDGSEGAGSLAFYTMSMNPDGEGPPGNPELLIADPRFADTPGWSHTPSPSGGLIYLQAPEERTVHYLRVVPGWVDEMKSAVDAANR